MGKTATSRDWSQIYAIYAIYGVEQWQTLVFLLLHALLLGVLSVLYPLYFDSIRSFFESILSVIISLPGGAAQFTAGFIGSVTALSAVCLLFAAANFFYSAVPLHHAMALRMLCFVEKTRERRNWKEGKIVNSH